MSTRCQVVIQDEYDSIMFYRHSDGYPEGVKETLSQFLSMVKGGKLRGNVEQSSGWLVVIGFDEYHFTSLFESDYGWKVGAYEPSSAIHGDIQYFYVIDLPTKKIRVYKIGNACSNVLDNVRKQVDSLLSMEENKRIDTWE